MQWLYVDQFVFSDLGTEDDEWEGKITMTVLNRPEAAKNANLSFSLYSDESFSWPALQRAIAENPSLPCQERARGPWTKVHRSVDKHDKFTITIRQGVPHFWYIMLDGCDHDNDNPQSSLAGLEIEFHWENPGGFFSREFSWDEYSLLPVRMVVFPVILVIGLAFFFIMHIWKREFHPLALLFSFCYLFWLTAVLYDLIHLFIYAIDGSGFSDLSDMGLALSLISEVMFLMLLFLMANGWTITQFHIRHKDTMQAIAIALCLSYASLYVWSKVLVSRYSTDYIFMELPGIIIAMLRVPCLAFFIYSLVMTIKREQNPKKKMFYRIFGIVYSIWFIILPAIVFIAFLVPPTYRSKVINNVYLLVTSLALMPMLALLVYSRYQQFFLFHKADRELLEAKAKARKSGAASQSEALGIVSANEGDFGTL